MTMPSALVFPTSVGLDLSTSGAVTAVTRCCRPPALLARLVRRKEYWVSGSRPVINFWVCFPSTSTLWPLPYRIWTGRERAYPHTHTFGHTFTHTASHTHSHTCPHSSPACSSTHSERLGWVLVLDLPCQQDRGLHGRLDPEVGGKHWTDTENKETHLTLQSSPSLLQEIQDP